MRRVWDGGLGRSEMFDMQPQVEFVKINLIGAFNGRIDLCGLRVLLRRNYWVRYAYVGVQALLCNATQVHETSGSDCERSGAC